MSFMNVFQFSLLDFPLYVGMKQVFHMVIFILNFNVMQMHTYLCVMAQIGKVLKIVYDNQGLVINAKYNHLSNCVFHFGFEMNK